MSIDNYHLMVAKTILTQIGGQRFITMTGARQFIALDTPGLQFDLPCDSMFVKQKIRRVQVRLDPCDTYTVLALTKQKGQLDYVVVAQQSGIYCDMLEAIFTDVTGLHTRL
ncbi:hypothetical protein [Photobacterium chitinilyticum]|uniref:Uncharacterized protein n=1 Tax=Photobacterium chitinilyticum TaxID=2485123 RepID=A0A3S3QPX7_9GAMM|nr:hypothetical protein [Photobacterium chitinilyticum]RWX52898.1 hypothetical protein EDI28_24875 [Photobacterium chitinilyticum]